MVGKSVLLVWATLICGRVLVQGKPQVYKPATSSSDPQKRSTTDLLEPSSSHFITARTGNGFDVSHGFSFDAAFAPNGEPYSSGRSYLGGSVSPGPTYLKDTTGFFGSSSDLWSEKSIDLATAGISVLSSLFIVYQVSPYLFGTVKKPVKNSTSNGNKDKDVPEATEKVTKSRRKRNVKINKADTDLTRLGSIVFNAIASGECLQKTICQIGTQVGESSKGRLAFSLIDTLLPPSLHGNQYFVTMKKSLKGEQLCERFICNNHQSF